MSGGHDFEPKTCPEAYLQQELDKAQRQNAELLAAISQKECEAAKWKEWTEGAERRGAELLAALKALVSRCGFDGIPNDSLPAVNTALAAIALAEGSKK